MKNVGGYAAGYTILEVMIFLAVSGVMFLIAIAFINGKQAQAEYSQSVGDVSTHLQQVLDNVMNGFYPTIRQSFSCTGNGPGGAPVPTYTGTGNDKGTNEGCVYIGEVVQFGVQGSNGQQYNVIPVVGNQVTSSSSPQAVTSFADAYPTVLTGSIENHSLLYGMHVTDMYLMDGSTKVKTISGFGVFTTFGGYTGTLLNSGAQSIRLTTIPGLDYSPGGGYVEGPSSSNVESDIADLQKKPDDFYTLTSSQYVTVCLKSGYDKPASVSLGNTKGNLSVSTQTGASVAGVCSS